MMTIVAFASALTQVPPRVPMTPRLLTIVEIDGSELEE